MRAPSPSAMLAAWERGLGQASVERGLTLLGLAMPGYAADALAAVSIGERDRHLLDLREAAFGPSVTGLVACTHCGELLELNFTTSDVRAEPVVEPQALTFCTDDHTLELRLPDSRDLLFCAASDADDAAPLLFERCLVSARVGDQILKAEQLPDCVRAAVAERLAAIDPQADVQLALSCPACRHKWTAPFDVESFLWTELTAWVTRFLRDVHLLASAYGWRESDILGLTDVRRREYLRMLGV